jgi:hypothetical protein
MLVFISPPYKRSLAKLERSSGGAPKHCSNIVHHYFALFHKENFDFCAAAPTAAYLASPVQEVWFDNLVYEG